MIQVNSLTKSYGRHQALQGISFEVADGELFGCIGPDGAGKTTLIRILVTLLLPDEGYAFMDGYDVIRDYKILRKRIGYIPGRFSLYSDLSVEENLTFFASVFHTTVDTQRSLIRDIYQYLEPYRDRRAGQLSGGMKQKLALCCALIHRPRILLLDEPTTGVDAVSRVEFWEILKKLQKEGMTIVVSTPYMDEAGLCDRVALMQNGKMHGIDKPSEIIRRFDGKLYAVKSSRMHVLLETLKNYPFTRSVYPFGEYLHYTDQRTDVDLSDLEHYLKKHQIHDAAWKTVEPDIEDCFIQRISLCV